MAKPLWQTLLKVTSNSEEQSINEQEYYNLLNLYLDMLVDGANPAEIIPLIKKHLKRCPECITSFDTVVSKLAVASLEATQANR